MTDEPTGSPSGLPVPRTGLTVADLAVRRATAHLVRGLPGVIGLAPPFGHRARGRALGALGLHDAEAEELLSAVEVIDDADGSTGVRIRVVLDDAIPMLATISTIQREVAALLRGTLAMSAPGDVVVAVVRTESSGPTALG